MMILLFIVSFQVFYPKENFNNPLILDLIFRQVDNIYSVFFAAMYPFKVHVSLDNQINPNLPISLYFNDFNFNVCVLIGT